MQATLIVWWLFLSCSCVVFGAEIDWNKLKEKLNDSKDESAVIEVAKNWDKRLPDFFQSIGQEAWQKISHHLSYSELNKIRPEEFQLMTPELLRDILHWQKVCPTTDISFWTEERIGHISGKCLHNILKEAKGTVKLGSMWKNVPISCRDLLKKPDFSLDCVHPDDRLLASEWIQKVIKFRPSICKALSISFWNEKTVNYMTATCLYCAINETRRPVVLGELWEHISPVILKGSIKSSILDRFKNVSGSDFQYMSSGVLQSIFSSKYALDYLPQPRSEIILSARASEVSMSPLQFAKLVKSAPSVAGQLLWYSTKLSKEALSECNGKDIRSLSLVIPGEERLDWRGLFDKLQKKYSSDGESERFGLVIQHISQNTENHFCVTLDLDEYQSLAWLHPNLSESCLSKLRFKPDEVSELFSRPELATGSLSWRKMLREYSPSDWALLSQSKRINDLLGVNCNFWGAISGGSWSKVFDALDKSIFRSIVPECVLKLTNILRHNPSIIQLLADDAFAKYRVDQLPCRFNNLSPAHIAHFSSKLVMSDEQSDQEKTSLKISLDKLKDLSFEQFKSLYESRWISIERGIKDTALNYQLERVQSQLLAAAKELKSNNFHQNFKEELTENQLNGFRTIEDTLTAVLELYKNSRQKLTETWIVSIFNAIKEPESWGTFVQALERSSKLGPAILGLVRDVDGLRHFILQAFGKITIQSGDLLLSHDNKSGFDRTGVIDILEKMPELFAAPNARVKSQRITDGGGVIRSLASQLLSDIGRDLVVPYTRAIDYGTIHHKARIGDSAGNSKFVWGISKQVGLAVGLAFGKALQLDIKLPFGLDSGLYELLIDTSDSAIEGYYETTYSQEVSEYRQSILGLYNFGDFDILLDILPKLDSLRFIKLSTKTSAEEAKQDKTAKTNLWGCSDEDCYENTQELEDTRFMENYIETILEKTLEEFKEFVRELVRGLGMAVPPVKWFKNWPILITRPFAEFLPELLNARPISGEDVLGRVDFTGSDQVPSLIQGQTTTAKQVFSAFVLSLDAKQLEHLIGIWTGSSTLMLNYSKLTVYFVLPGKIESYQVNFWKEGKENYPVASEQEYRVFFEKFSQNLLGHHDADVKPYCGSERLGIIPAIIRVCSRMLLIYLQSAEEMLNSLIDLLRTPLTTFRVS